jgi:hypothetical protein
MTDHLDFACGHVPEFIVQSHSAMDSLNAMQKADFVAVCVTTHQDGTLSSIAFVEQCRMVWLHNSPYSVRRLLQSKEIKKIGFGVQDVTWTNYVDLQIEMSNVFPCQPPKTLKQAEALAGLNTNFHTGCDLMCPQCEAASIYKIHNYMKCM